MPFLASLDSCWSYVYRQGRRFDGFGSFGMLWSVFARFSSSFGQARSVALLAMRSIGPVWSLLNELTRFCMGSEQFRVGAVGSAPCNEEHRTGLDVLERFRTLFEQVVAWCTDTI